MNKFACACGHIIRGQTDDLPYKGVICKDQDYEAFFEPIAGETQALVDAASAGAVEEWIQQRFGADHPRDFPAREMMSDLVTRLVVSCRPVVYECEQCGRLWVERKAEGNVFVSYMPESGAYEAVLKAAPHRKHD